MARQLIIMKRAENAIYKVAQHRALEYFPETGERFIHEIIDFCLEYAGVNTLYPLCKNAILRKHGYSCIVFKKKWVVVFKVTTRHFRVCRFVWGPNLK